MMRLAPWCLAVACVALSPVLLAQTVAPVSTAPMPAPAGSVTTLQAVTVSGVQPGPGLWKVSGKGHVMWILGTSSPLPEKVEWESANVEHAIAGAQEVIDVPALKIDAKIGFFGKLFLLPSIYSARRNEDGRTLQQIVPPADYVQWTVLKARYLGGDHGIERWRPIFAAMELAKKALKAQGLSTSGGVTAKVDALAAQYHVPVVQAKYQVVVQDPRAALKAFKAAGPDDIACFHDTMLALDSELPQMAQRANAWATGDLDELRRTLDVQDPRVSCAAAISEAGFAKQLGLDDVAGRVRATWLAAAQDALMKYPQSFAMLSMEHLLKPDGYLAGLRAAGYTVTAPDDPGATLPNAPAPAASASAPVAAASAPAKH